MNEGCNLLHLLELYRIFYLCSIWPE